MAIVDANMISAHEFKVRRQAVEHKQETLATALHCSARTIRNFEKGKTRRLYAVRWGDLARELGIPQELPRSN
jgi:DNA-binding XRE family transcriptional regulator